MAQQTAVVPVKSAWISKINWTQVGALLLSGIVAINPDDTLSLIVNPDPATKAAIIFGIQSLQTGVTLVLRTWFNKSVTPS